MQQRNNGNGESQSQPLDEIAGAIHCFALSLDRPSARSPCLRPYVPTPQPISSVPYTPYSGSNDVRPGLTSKYPVLDHSFSPCVRMGRTTWLPHYRIPEDKGELPYQIDCDTNALFGLCTGSLANIHNRMLAASRLLLRRHVKTSVLRFCLLTVGLSLALTLVTLTMASLEFHCSHAF